MLPSQYKCPYCKTELELTQEEMMSGSFICPNCEENYNAKDYEDSYNIQQFEKLKNPRTYINFLLMVIVLFIALLASSLVLIFTKNILGSQIITPMLLSSSLPKNFIVILSGLWGIIKYGIPVYLLIKIFKFGKTKVYKINVK